MIRIPPNILYPGMIFGLLGMSLTMCTILVITARAGHGAQIENDYYQRSINWDQSQRDLQHGRLLHWNLDITLTTESPGKIVVTDANNQPVEGMTAQITLRRPELANELSTTPLTAIPGQPGHYAFAHHPTSIGLLDLTIEGDFSDQHIRFERRHEVR